MATMNVEDFVPYLGKTDDSPEIAKLLAKLGVTRKPKLKRGELYDHVQLKKDGLVLVFRESQDPKTSQIVLMSVQCYSAAEEGFKTFAGKLPHGLDFSDTRPEVLKKVGKPSKVNKTMRTDSWERKGFFESVQYTRDTGEIQMVSLTIPIKY